MIALTNQRWKPLGYIIAVLGLVGIITIRLFDVSLISNFNPAQQHALFQFILLFGLVGVILSKEKNEDERTVYLRARTFQIVFMYTIAVLLAISLSVGLSAHPTLSPYQLFIFPSISIILYLLLFNTGLYFNFVWDYLRFGKHVGTNWGALAMLAVFLISVFFSYCITML